MSINYVTGYGVRLNDAAKRLVRRYAGRNTNFDAAYESVCADWGLDTRVSTTADGKKYYFFAVDAQSRYDARRGVRYIKINEDMLFMLDVLADVKAEFGLADQDDQFFIAEDHRDEAGQTEDDPQETPVDDDPYLTDEDASDTEESREEHPAGRARRERVTPYASRHTNFADSVRAFVADPLNKDTTARVLNDVQAMGDDPVDTLASLFQKISDLRTDPR